MMKQAPHDRGISVRWNMRVLAQTRAAFERAASIRLMPTTVFMDRLAYLIENDKVFQKMLDKVYDTNV